MYRSAVLFAFAALLAASGCTTMVSSGPPRRRHPPGRARGWGHANPRLVVIAGTGVRYVADIDDDIFIHGGLWYRFSGGVWFRCGTWGGGWARISAPPVAFHRIPPKHVKHRVIRGHRPPPPRHRPPPPKHRPGKGPKHRPGKGSKSPKHRPGKEPKGPKRRGKGRW